MQKKKENQTLTDAVRALDNAFKGDSDSFELPIFRLLAEGYALHEIALRLNVKDSTVRFYSNQLRRRIREHAAKTVPSPKIQHQFVEVDYAGRIVRPPMNAEYVLYLLLRKEEREIVIGDLLECYSVMVHRFDKRRADIWFYKQVIGSIFPLLRRQVLRIGALVWLGRILRRLIS
jgi:hypothetical protein